MFIQMMEGRVADEDGLRRQLDAWRTDLAPGAEGWVGATMGVTADGTYVAVVRFESEAAAQANASRPEQGAWWEAFSATIDGDVTFTNCTEVDTFGAGGSDDAGFVQIMIGRGDRAQIAPLADELSATLAKARPDVIGGTVGWPGDGSFVQTVYFSSEAEARKAESADPASQDDREAMERLNSLMTFERFIDLPNPMMYTA
jgi:hypothetical protein